MTTNNHGPNGMTTRDKDALIDTFMYYCPPEVRRKLMAECPQAYNRYCGYTVVEVTIINNGRVVQENA